MKVTVIQINWDLLDRDTRFEVMFGNEEAIKTVSEDKLEEVAVFNYRGGLSAMHVMEQVFQFTNTIEPPWYETRPTAGLEVKKPEGCRSTSVGDLMKVEGFGHEDGTYMVASVGFQRLREK